MAREYLLFLFVIMVAVAVMVVDPLTALLIISGIGNLALLCCDRGDLESFMHSAQERFTSNLEYRANDPFSISQAPHGQYGNDPGYPRDPRENPITVLDIDPSMYGAPFEKYSNYNNATAVGARRGPSSSAFATGGQSQCGPPSNIGTTLRPIPRDYIYSASELDGSADTAMMNYSRSRARDQRCMNGAVSKDADYYRYHYAGELDAAESRVWWGRDEY